jgi:carboxyl-terminal processing protease
MRLTIARYYTPTGRSIQKSYKNGLDEYNNDLAARFEHGEFADADSIHFADSLRYTTPEGKVVYGGGGIMPDIFVPVDTTGRSTYIVAVQPLIYRFALNYTEINREMLKQYTDAAEMEKYLDNQHLLDKFVEFASRNGVRKDPAGLKASGLIIQTQLKAYIARNMLDSNGFYMIWKNQDAALKAAISFLEKKQ